MDQKSKKAAAIAAVIAYIKSEEEALSLQMSMMQPAPVPSPISPTPLKFWGISGRQDQMNLRMMMQLKGFHR